MEQIENDNCKLLYKKLQDIKPNIILETYRGKIYCNLLKSFIISCISNLNTFIFTNKKSFNRTVTNLLASWFFTLYSNYDFSDDPFFPTNPNYTSSLKSTLEHYCSIHENIKNVDDKINNIITDLLKSYQIIKNQLEVYKISDFYTENKNNYYITKTIVTEKRNDICINFYKLRVVFKCKLFINNIRLSNILDNLIIPIDEYNNISNRFTGPQNSIDEYIWVILFRYQILGSNNNQLAVLPNVLESMKTDLNLSIECFASTINTTSKQYCSIYYDIEKYFGSLGSFFNIELHKGTYSFNPPYQTDIIERGINKIIYSLQHTNDKLAFIITIPIWDNEGKEFMETNNMKNNNTNINYGDFEIINIMKNSYYFKGLRMISKEDFTYLDHNFLLYKNKTIQNTYIIVMANFDNNYIEYINNYDFYTYPI